MKIFLLLNFVFLIYILMCVETKNKKIICYTIFFVLLAFITSKIIFTDPTYDINVYIKDLQNYRINGLIKGFSMSEYNGYPAISMLFCLMSLFPNEALQVVSALICYGIIVFLLDKIDLPNKLDKFMLIVYILVSIDFVSSINGIRSIMCFSFIALALYLKFKNSKYYFIPFLISLGIHSFSVIFIVIWLLKKKINYKVIITGLLILVFFKLNPDITLPFEGIPFIGSLLLRVRLYLYSSFTLNSTVIYCISIFLCGIFLKSLFISKNDIDYDIKNLIIGLCIVCLGLFIVDIAVLKRVLIFMPFIVLAIAPYYKERISTCKRTIYLLNTLLMLYYFLSFLMMCYTSYMLIIF
ncbi:EpsG family protein [Amedibacillus sp. YH-ame6]